jgi:hypothetical protein
MAATGRIASGLAGRYASNICYADHHARLSYGSGGVIVALDTSEQHVSSG